jgi:hypothetical protein
MLFQKANTPILKCAMKAKWMHFEMFIKPTGCTFEICHSNQMDALLKCATQTKWMHFGNVPLPPLQKKVGAL